MMKNVARFILIGGLLLSFLLSFDSVGALDADVIYVDASGSGYTTIEAGIAAVNSGGTVYVAPGQYDAETFPILIDKNVSIIGTNDSYGVVIVNSSSEAYTFEITDVSVTLKNLVMEGGKDSVNASFSTIGSSLTIDNCIMAQPQDYCLDISYSGTSTGACTITDSSFFGCGMDAIYICSEDSADIDITIDNCEVGFTSNPYTSSLSIASQDLPIYVGNNGIYINTINDANSDIKISSIESHFCGGNGLYVRYVDEWGGCAGGSLEICDSLIFDNCGYGFFLESNTNEPISVSISDSVVSDNDLDAIRVSALGIGTVYFSSYLTICYDSCNGINISGNVEGTLISTYACYNQESGILIGEDALATIDKCELFDNMEENISLEDCQDATVKNCVLFYNSMTILANPEMESRININILLSSGSVIFIGNSTTPSGEIIISNNTIVGGEYGIYCVDACPIIANNIISECLYGIDVHNTVIFPFGNDIGSSDYNPITHNDVWCMNNYDTMVNLTGIAGNISVDPLLENIFMLSELSPCIDAGMDTSSAEYGAVCDSFTYDLTTVKRPQGAYYDMGAMEYPLKTTFTPYATQSLVMTNVQTVNNLWEYIVSALPESPSDEISGMVASIQDYMGNAAMLGNPIYANGQLEAAKRLMYELVEMLGM